jgi:hypothetical protein
MRGMTPDLYPLIPADARITADPPMLITLCKRFARYAKLCSPFVTAALL